MNNPDEEQKMNNDDDHENKSAKSMPSLSSIYNKVDRAGQVGLLVSNGPAWTLPKSASALSTTNDVKQNNEE